MRLTDRIHLMQLIPSLHSFEQKSLVWEVAGQKVMVIFDATTAVAEVFAVLVRWTDDSFNTHQRLTHLGFYQSSFKTEHVVQVIVEAITRRLNLPLDAVVAFQRDRAAVNSAAIQS